MKDNKRITNGENHWEKGSMVRATGRKGLGRGGILTDYRVNRQRATHLPLEAEDYPERGSTEIRVLVVGRGRDCCLDASPASQRRCEDCTTKNALAHKNKSLMVNNQL